MASRTANIASSIVAGILAGTLLTAPRGTANAAECLTEPGKDGTRGQHWYYRIESSSKRHCWYLRDADGTASQTTPLDDSDQAPQAAARSRAKLASPEDARAEFPVPQVRGYAVAAPAPGPAPLASSPVPALPQADAQGSAVAARWPSLQTAPAPAATAPAATADATDAAPAADEAAGASSDTAVSAPVPAAASPAPAKPSVSLQMLFAVIGGALALAGLTASIVYRLGRRRQRRLATSERRAVLWEAVDSGPKPPWVPPEVEDTAPLPLPERRPVQTFKPQERYEKIEEILAQLVRQAQQSDA